MADCQKPKFVGIHGGKYVTQNGDGYLGYCGRHCFHLLKKELLDYSILHNQHGPDSLPWRIWNLPWVMYVLAITLGIAELLYRVHSVLLFPQWLCPTQVTK